MTNEVAEVKQTFSELLAEKLDMTGDACPPDLNKALFVQNALALVNDNPSIQKYGASKIIAGLMKGAFLGLDFLSSEAYLVPYGDKLTYQTSYKGMIKLAKKYSIRPVLDIFGEVVRQGDEFSRWADDEGQHYSFKPKPFNEGAIIGAFSICEFVDGGIFVETMTLAELETTRSQSKAKNAMAWSSFRSEMYKKTVVKRLAKKLELD